MRVVAHNHLQRFLTISHDFPYLYSHAGAPFSINEQEIANVIEEALRVPLQPLQDKAVPTTLLTAEQVAQRVRDTQPASLVRKRRLQVRALGKGRHRP